MLRYVTWFSGAGIGIATVIFILAESYTIRLEYTLLFNTLTLTLWPGSIFMMVTYGLDYLSVDYLGVLGFSLATNAVLYGVIGAVVWVGVYKVRLVLLGLITVAVSLVTWLWYTIYLT